MDPLGLYQIADQLAVMLVPAVRERMQRIRFLTAMAVGAMVTEGMEEAPQFRDASPYLVWEWLVVEAIVRTSSNGSSVQGVPGSDMARRALQQHNYLDARSYLKNPRIFGFNGVYKRLAVHLKLLDVNLGPGPRTEELFAAWARDLRIGSREEAKSLVQRWSAAVRRSLGEKPPRTKTNWTNREWTELAVAFAPEGAQGWEKSCLREALLAADDRKLGALPALWRLQSEFDDKEFREEPMHVMLQGREPVYGSLLTAIRNYETFSRNLKDAFDLLKAVAAGQKTQGFLVIEIARDEKFNRCVEDLHEQFMDADSALGEVGLVGSSLRNTFSERFSRFAEPMDAGSCGLALCAHHEAVQQAKSADGKRPWFDRIGTDRIYIRHAYREPRQPIQPGRYVHGYRGWPIRRFYRDLK